MEVKRLNKIARECNVGVSTLIEFLQKKVDPKERYNPNTKIGPEVYDTLIKEFAPDLKIKQKKEQMDERRHNRQREQESVTLPKGPHEQVKLEEEKEAKEETISASNHIDNRPKFKVVDKIDLDTAGKPKKAEVKEEAPKPKKDEAVVETAPVAKSEPEVKAEPETKAVEKPKVEAPEQPKAAPVVEKPQKTKPVEKVEETKAPVAQKETAKPKPETPKVVVEKKEEVIKDVSAEKPAEPAKVEAPKQEVKAPIAEKTSEDKPTEEKPAETNVEDKEDGVFRVNNSKVDNKTKVVGKIDLSTINQRTRPAKKSKEEKRKEREKREKTKRPNDQNQQNKGGVIKAAPDKLNGPKVVGKIDLNKDADGQPKKKRKRIRKDGKEKVDINKPQGQNPQGGQNRPGARRNDNRKGNPRNNRRPVVKNEISEEDVQKKVKDTLARLTNKSKGKGAKYRREKRDVVAERQQAELEKQMAEQNVLKLAEFVTPSDLSSMMNVPVTNIISTFMSLGMFVSINQRLDAETISIVAEEFNYKVEFVSVEVAEAIEEDEDDETKLQERPPIVTVMGHVDHGKTSLLDYIRSANVIAGEAGGITQHIGAYNVTTEAGKQITFLDTPGHEAFTAMRARGAKVTDIAIIIVAADDDVMPQTIEAINHAAAAEVPMVFAINKIDKPGANPEKIKEQLANMNYLVEDWGGKYQCQEISAKHGKNIEELMEKVLLESELLELKANPDKSASGSIIESTLDKGRGYVATVLVQNGTLRVGDIVLAGQYHGHVKAMFNERNQRITEAGPAEPVLLLGLNGAPQAGDNFNVMKTEKEAREIANKREQLQREQGQRTNKHITLDEIGRRIAIGNFQELNIIVKGDVDGSIEALADSLIKLSTEEIQVKIINKGVGQISEADIYLAAASDALILGFQVRPSLAARKLAEKEEIDIRLYSIIYDAIEEVKSAMEGMLSPEIKEEITATLEIRETFKITKVGTIAGCMVREGKINRNHKVRLIREGIVIYTGLLGSLKRFKDDVKEVASGYECGCNIEKYNDIKVGDLIESYKEVEVTRTL